MVTINYIGQFGNCMFQYVFARLVAEYNQQNLYTHGPLEIQCTPLQVFEEQPNKKGTITISDIDYYNHRTANGSTIPILDCNYDYVISGYFQDAELYNLYVDKIRSFFNLPYIEPIIDEPLVMVRLGDFIHSGTNSEIIHYNWYKNVFKFLNKPKIFTITSNGINRSPSTKEQEILYINNLIDKNDTILQPKESMIAEFLDVMNYKIVVCSNSTWGWWATFLSKSTEVYTFKKFGYFGTDQIRSHGVHINNLANIRNISSIIDGDFIDITLL